MKAAMVVAPGELAVREVPPPPMGEYDALCELLYGATCTGTDLHIIHGRCFRPVACPSILGHESIGRVVETGAKVRNLRVGDLVTRVGAPASPTGEYHVNWGGFAELGIARDYRAAREGGLDPGEWDGFRVNQALPAGLDPAASTMIITWRETLSYLTRMGVGPGATVLVIGSGGNGLAFAAHAANLGAARAIVLGSAARESAARAAGATDYFAYRAEDALEQIGEAAPDGVDFLVDAVGKSGIADSALPLLRDGGTLGIYGVDDCGKCAVTPTRARGTFRFYNGGYDEEETHEQVVRDVADGRLDAGLWLDLSHPFPLKDIGAAFEAVAARRAIKALVRLRNPQGH
jgi:threonine dehydrogenase-like Zn-dependent dehydrogenase